uniref:Uncharacterized protein n=1 Tax=Kuenenia stuttgartiensis TaxID=174633 RepID=Q1Q0S6_KUEST|nr:unknown protein [Candidatus Kuenenia stuttgartiensis]
MTYFVITSGSGLEIRCSIHIPKPHACHYKGISLSLQGVSACHCEGLFRSNLINRHRDPSHLHSFH